MANYFRVTISESEVPLVLGTSAYVIGHVVVDTEPGAYTTPTHTNPTIGTQTTVALAANTTRLYALFANQSGEEIDIKLGTAAVLAQGIPIPNGYNYEMSKKFGNLYTGTVNGICTSGGKTLLVVEGV